jgi:hypothetical protein
MAPVVTKPIRITLRLLARVHARKVVTEEGCWEWPGAHTRGYARLRHDGELVQVHRILWCALNGVDNTPVGFDLDHRCNNKGCINP